MYIECFKKDYLDPKQLFYINSKHIVSVFSHKHKQSNEIVNEVLIQTTDKEIYYIDKNMSDRDYKLFIDKLSKE